MIDAVFISDIHLHPDDHAIASRFEQFVHWAAKNTTTLYILGDFLHVWPGDDTLDGWSRGIAGRLAWLAEQGVVVYLMRGNRDFLLGEVFAKLAGVKLITEPHFILLGEEPGLLCHGDRYCTRDRSHQWFRRLTRNPWFPKLFLRFPLRVRLQLVNQIRKKSSARMTRTSEQMAVVEQVLVKHMQENRVSFVIHGHIHQPGITEHQVEGAVHRQYVLSDWDDSPQILCYDNTKGVYFVPFEGESCHD